MKKFVFITLLFFSFQLFAQKHTGEWDLFLKNKRKEALNMLTKKKASKKDLEAWILEQFIKESMGEYKRDSLFHQNFVKFKDYPYYLFALWNDEFIFSDYLSNGFNNKMYANLNWYYKQNIQKPVALSYALKYLKAITELYYNNPKLHDSLLHSIPTLNKWQYCGTFENLNDSGINIAYPPEKTAYSEKDFNANSNGKLNWYVPKKDTEIYWFFVNHTIYGSGINYAQSFVESPVEQDVYLRLGIGKAAKVWVNDVLIFEKTEDRITDLDAYTLKVHLSKGVNRILLKTTNDSYTYFIVRITDREGNSIDNLTYSDQYKDYHKATVEEVAPELQENEFEAFFQQKINQNPDNVFYKILLAKTYLRNSKGQKAEKILDKLLEKYPKSTYLRKMLSKAYFKSEHDDKAVKLLKNIENDDPDSFIAISRKLADSRKLLRKDVEEMNAFFDKVRKLTDHPVILGLCDLLSAARQGDQNKLKDEVDKLIDFAMKNGYIKLVTSYAGIKARMFDSQDEQIALLKKINENYFYTPAYYDLIKIYEKRNDNDKVLELYKALEEKFPATNSYKHDIADKYITLQEYDQALPYVKASLKNFPYDFNAMQKQGVIYQLTGKKKQAVKWFKKSLSHNSGNFSLRKRIDDLLNREDPLKEFFPSEAYAYIQQNRGKKENSNHDLKILLDEIDVQLFDEGGYRYRGIFIYEVNSQQGIEKLKEYELNITGNYQIYKSEIVKPDGSIVPADRSNTSLVFKDLAIGDVVYIDYDAIVTSTGRFYKDITDSDLFDGIYPSVKTVFRLVVPQDGVLYHKELNGDVPFNKKHKKKLVIYQWIDENIKAMPPEEAYMPDGNEVSRVVFVSTIDSWQKIANWYADLSSMSIKYDNVVNKTFDEIFPEGYEHLTENERAKKIYDYIAENINYSYVDFRQSGQIPQKPSKVIDTKLGDCKDLSTLFLTMGRKAGLNVNLVLVKTNDYGRNSLVLPSRAFNHAIVRLTIDGQVQYLELTDKYLPYKSLPVSLLGACALEIPYDKDDNLNKSLIHLDDLNQTKTVLQTDVVYDIYKDKQEISIKITSQGRMNSALNQMLDEKNEDILKKNITRYFEDFDKLDLDLISYKIIQKDPKKQKTIFEAKFTVNDKMQSFGSSKIFKLPLQLKPYTSDLVNLNNREYPIVYAYYENVDEYISHYQINLKDGGKFIEIPENVDLKYKGHAYRENFKIDNQGTLQVDIDAQTPIKNISPEEYPAFKKYVKEALKAMDVLIGFKK